MQQDERYIKECLELAKLAEGRVSPNPMVGSIILDQYGEVVGRGHHIRCGEAHAEVCALKEAGDKAKNGTLYVNLEPCSHQGKTPPCIDKIIKSGIKRLVVGMEDPNPLVVGNGVKKAIEAGIQVKLGVAENECKKFNEVFIKHISLNQPFISVKTGITIDGKIATKSYNSKWITSEDSREEVQRLRNKYDAILTGSGTVVKDNPSLTCRLNELVQLPSCYNRDENEVCSVTKTGRNPVRIIVDSMLVTSPDSNVYKEDGTRVIIAVGNNIEESKFKLYPNYIEFIKCPLNEEKKVDLNFLTSKLYKAGIYSILVEAGGKLNGAFTKKELVDKFYFFIAPKILGDNQAFSFMEGFNIQNINEALQLRFGEIKHFPPDIMLEGYLA